MRAEEDLRRSSEVVEIFKNKIVKFNCAVFQVQDDSAYPIGIDGPLDDIEFCIVPLF